MVLNENTGELYESLKELLEEVFESVDFTDSIRLFQTFYNQYHNNGFEPAFEDILNMIMTENTHHTAIQRAFNFISEAVVTLPHDYLIKQDGDTQIRVCMLNSLCMFLLELIKQYSMAQYYIARWRSCQFLTVLLMKMQNIGVDELDEGAFQMIAKVVQSRRRDVSPIVRSEVMLLAKFLQDPTDPEDYVISSLMWQMKYDTSATVRKNVVNVIAACEETVLSITESFLYDSNAVVRNAALLRMSDKISPHSYSNQQRVAILYRCFTDPSDVVCKTAKNRLLPVWFNAYHDDLTVFLKALRLENVPYDDMVFMHNFICLIFGSLPTRKIIEMIDLDTDSYLPKTTLTAEKAFIWYKFCEFAPKTENTAHLVPHSEDLIAYIVKFCQLNFGEDYSIIYNDLIKMLLLNTSFCDKTDCSELVPHVHNLTLNPLAPMDVIPMSIKLSFFAAKATISSDLRQVIQALRNMYSFAESEVALLRCLKVLSEALALNIEPQELEEIKDNMILPSLESENVAIFKEAIRALTLYSLSCKEEAKICIGLFQKELKEISEKSDYILKGILDILQHYGSELFGNADDPEKMLEDTLKRILSSIEEDEDLKLIMTEGILKLYLSNDLYSPFLLSKMLLFIFDKCKTEKTPKRYCKRRVREFLSMYGRKEEVEIKTLSQAMIDLFKFFVHCKKSSVYYSMDLKDVVSELIAIAKQNFHTSPEYEEFRDTILCLLTEEVNEKPSRIKVQDLLSFCNESQPTRKLEEIHQNIKNMLHNMRHNTLVSNYTARRCQKFFANYLSSIETSIDPSKSSENQVDSASDLNIEDASVSDKTKSVEVEAEINMSDDNSNFEIPPSLPSEQVTESEEDCA